jgi:hypothetical protein
VEDAAVDELLTDSEERPDTVTVSPAEPEDGTAPAPAKPGPGRPSAAVVRCPLCQASSIPTETLAGGRVRCCACKRLFLPGGPGPARPTAPPTVPRSPIGTLLSQLAYLEAPAPPRPSKVARKHGNRRSLLAAWVRPSRLAAVAAVVALACLSPRLWTSNHPRVFPARGQAFLAGEPVDRASIVLFPVWTKEPDFPRPHGVVKEDGSFVLETYGNADGAPPGEYKVVVTLFLKREGEDFEGSGPPKNFLPPKYASANSSDLTVQVNEGNNDLPPLRLER